MVNLENVMEAVSVVTNVPTEKIFGKDRHRDIMSARHLYCYMAKVHTNNTLQNIGRYIDKDHTTVINSIKVVNDMIDTEYDVFVDMVNRCNDYITLEYKKPLEMTVLLPFGVELVKVKGFLEGLGCVVR